MKKVIIYTSDTCGYCKMAKEYLHENGVEFIEKNVNTDPSAQKDMRDMGATGVPVIIIDGEVIMGFSKERLDALVGKLIVECPKCRKKIRLPRNKGTLEVKCPSCSNVFRVDSNKN